MNTLQLADFLKMKTWHSFFSKIISKNKIRWTENHFIICLTHNKNFFCLFNSKKWQESLLLKNLGKGDHHIEEFLFSQEPNIEEDKLQIGYDSQPKQYILKVPKWFQKKIHWSIILLTSRRKSGQLISICMRVSV